MPRLTIGLIIYNGVGSVRQCLDGLLSQTFQDFTLLIYDNASVDGTSEICAEYAARDSRIQHVRHPVTVSQSENFRSVLMAADTEYFMWAADDDVWKEQYAELCIERLDSSPQAVACCTEILFKYPDGSERLSRSTHPIVGTPAKRVKKYLANPRDSARLYAVYRTADLKASYPEGLAMFGYDWIIVCLTLLHGDHLQAAGVHLDRSGHAQGKYFERYDRHFVREEGVSGRLSYLFPLWPLTRALVGHLPSQLRIVSIIQLLRLNLHQTLMLLVWKYPRLSVIFRVSRAVDRFLGLSRA